MIVARPTQWNTTAMRNRYEPGEECKACEGRRTEDGGRRTEGGVAAVIGYRLSVIGYRLSVIGYRLSVIGYRLSVIGKRRRNSGLTRALRSARSRRHAPPAVYPAASAHAVLQIAELRKRGRQALRGRRCRRGDGEEIVGRDQPSADCGSASGPRPSIWCYAGTSWKGMLRANFRVQKWWEAGSFPYRKEQVRS
jgi:hypothetical protein